MAATTTHITVVCPNCGREAGMSLRRVEVSLEDVIYTSDGQNFVTSLSAELRAFGPHRCEVQN